MVTHPKRCTQERETADQTIAVNHLVSMSSSAHLSYLDSYPNYFYEPEVDQAFAISLVF